MVTVTKTYVFGDNFLISFVPRQHYSKAPFEIKLHGTSDRYDMALSG